MTTLARTLAMGMVLVLGACDGGSPTETDTDPPPPPAGPEMTWTAPTEALTEGTPLVLDVGADDPDGVARVVAYYRTEGTRTWYTAPDMEETEGVWTVELTGDAVQAPGLELYFKGEDDLGASSFLPAAGTREPFVVPVRRIGETLPYRQGFEDIPNERLVEIGWTETALAFEGYEWGPTIGRAAEGEASVVHRRAPEQITGDIDDWLISPPLDLTSVDAAQVSWMEYGDTPEAATHSLWISTGSPDPADGEFEKVADLAQPIAGQWSRSPVIDLSAWKDAAAAHLAWRYEGKNADIWWIDDVWVRQLGPDIRIGDLSWTPDPIGPGDSGTLLLTLDNRTNVAAPGVSVTVAADAGATFTSPISAGDIAGLGSAEIAVPFTIDGGFYENAWIDLAITATSGEESWELEDRLLVGQETLLDVTYTIEPADESDTAQLVRMVLGAGDPLEPDVEIPLVNKLLTSGTYDVELDITEHAEFLPPAPDNRWWIRVETGPLGTIDAFSITYGGETQASEDLGLFTGFAATAFFLPEPPDLRVVESSTSPTRVAPGDTVAWVVTLQNQGASTSGATTIEVTTADPDITLITAGPTLLAASPGLGRGARASGSFAFSVASTRKSSRSARFIAHVTDDYETIEVPVDVPIPWPVLSVTGIGIDDWSDGDNDGLLDEGEFVNLEIGLSNVGGRETFGAVSCVLSITGGTATATLGETSGFFGRIAAASTEEEDDYELTVTKGAVGDDIELLLTCTDGTEPYVVPFELIVGERPWIAITPTRDAIGDNRDDYRFDFVDGIYRSDGETLEIILRSDIEHGGLSGLFIEAWGSSSGGAYTFYNLVAAGSTGSVRGYRGGFTPLGSMKVSEVDAKSVKLDVDLTALELRVTSINLGFAAGFCGGTTQYCDHYPDGWGAPYTGLSTSRWVTLKW